MSISMIYTIRQQLSYYGISTLLITGNFGNLLLILILGRSLKRHANSCSLYLLVASLANCFVLDTALVSALYSIDHVAPTHSSNVLCKLRWFGGHVLFMISRCCMIAACVDRWALCSHNTRIRSLCQFHIARRAVAAILLFSIIITSPLFICYDNSTGRCTLLPSYALAYTIFAFLAIGLLPLILMIVFSLLVSHNLRVVRSRIKPAGNAARRFRVHKRDHDLMKMLAGEVLIYCITQFPFSINIIYGYYTSSFAVYKSPLRVAIESLISSIIHPLLSFTSCCTQFYICVLVSRSFRKQVARLFRQRSAPHCPTRTVIRLIGSKRV